MGEKIEKKTSLSEQDIDRLMVQYQVLADRHNYQNGLIWSAPSLLFVSLALLWGIGINQDINPIIRVIDSMLSVFVGVLALQFFSRARAMEIADAEQLFSIEEALQKRGNKFLIVHHRIEKRTLLLGEEKLSERLENLHTYTMLGKNSAYKWWTTLFIIAIFLSGLLAIYNIIECRSLFCSFEAAPPSIS